ncbi:hypothetical protein F4775DRAFT_548513 [Biscogniauxia sp. FL1348]|nr:hypothetical protein F4775DRAFT_548513 [Biscogniauxia sp. FL1348]
MDTKTKDMCKYLSQPEFSGNDDSRDSLLSHEQDSCSRANDFRRLSILALLVVNTVLFIGLITTAASIHKIECTDLESTAQTSFYSPLLEPGSGAVEYEIIKFQGGFEANNVWKGAPNKELDQAWDRLTRANFSGVDGEVLDRLGVPRTAVRYAEEDGGQYMVLIEVVHQLHCLNVIRMYTYREYYSRPENRPLEFTDREGTVRMHVDHCVDMLRQVLMCQADVGLVPFYWVEGQGPNENFSTPHRCRRLDRIMEWAQRHPVPAREPVSRPDTVWLSRLPL